MGIRMTEAEYQNFLRTGQAADSPVGRYGKNKRIKTVEGKFDSKGELARWKFLCLMERMGAISNLRRQVRYEIAHNGEDICAYVADFVYYLAAGGTIVEDFKGKIITPEFNLKRKLMKAFFGVTVLIVTRVREEPGQPSPVQRRKKR